MSFRKHLQQRAPQDPLKQGELSMPTSPKFKPAHWRNVFEKLSDGTAEDQNAFESSWLLVELMERLREGIRLGAQRSAPIGADELAIAVMRLLNAESARLHHGPKNRDLPGTVALEQLVHSRNIEGPPGAENYTGTEALESLVESVRFPLRQTILRGHGTGVVEPLPGEIPPFLAEKLALQSAQIYSLYERMWESVRWLDTRVDASGSHFVFDETLDPSVADAVVNRARREIRYARRALDAHLRDWPRQGLADKVIMLDQNGNARVVRLESAGENAFRYTLFAFIQWKVTTDVYSQALAQAEHDGVGTKLQRLVGTWMHLSIVAAQCLDRATEKSEQAGSMLPASPEVGWSIEKVALVRLISECIQASPQVTERILRRFTFCSDVTHPEAFDRPLVEINGRVHFCWHALIGCNFDRLIGALAEDDGVAALSEAHGNRGHTFEDVTAEVLRQAIANSAEPRLRSARILKARLDPEDKRVGDVDCVLIVGSTVFCIECRVGKHAASPHEDWAQLDDLLDKKGPQAIRKRDYVLRDPSVIEAVALREGKPLEQKIERVVALVVSNSYMLEGQQESEPYFVHIETLEELLGAGPLFGDIEGDGTEVEYRVDHFAGEVDVAGALVKALRAPAKAEFYWMRLARKQFHVPGVVLPKETQDGPAGFVQQWTVEAPASGELFALLSRRSFAARLEKRIVNSAKS